MFPYIHKVSDRAGSRRPLLLRFARCCFPSWQKRQHPGIIRYFTAQYSACTYLCQRFAKTRTDFRAWLEAGMESYSFTVWLFRSLHPTGFDRRFCHYLYFSMRIILSMCVRSVSTANIDKLTFGENSSSCRDCVMCRRVPIIIMATSTDFDPLRVDRGKTMPVLARPNPRWGKSSQGWAPSQQKVFHGVFSFFLKSLWEKTWSVSLPSHFCIWGKPAFPCCFPPGLWPL